MLSGSNKKVSAEANQIVNEAGCSLIFRDNKYYARSQIHLVVDYRTAPDGYIHGRGMELRNSGDALQISVCRWNWND